jgi:hypothetical protein
VLDPYTSLSPSFDVHRCGTSDIDHPLHRRVGMTRPGWYVITRNGCLRRVLGPFEVEPEAQGAGNGWLSGVRQAKGLDR